MSFIFRSRDLLDINKIRKAISSEFYKSDLDMDNNYMPLSFLSIAVLYVVINETIEVLQGSKRATLDNSDKETVCKRFILLY